MIFSLFGARLVLLHLRDCRGRLSLERIMCLNFVGELTWKFESGGGIRSNQFIGCTYNQLQDICDYENDCRICS